ncbi:TonB-dependent receptor [Steroidobacter sp. S1-65]|uniref:TonB-dependent receptor n=1 Tax=Steroidobacter gossypii TaxID=2805490 RepID=A0ABS1WZW7_9GAMM|nr:TonB-dependent receptor [Steroidobacter gossypii]MBM0106519.1 TonB-dependent receptor [Steroidobacter gossypii]
MRRTISLMLSTAAMTSTVGAWTQAAAQDAASGSEAAATTNVTGTLGRGVEEVIVSAQKEAERLQDVPVPVSVISADQLASNNQLRIQDYYTRSPGLGLALIGDAGVPTIAIRGITTGGVTNPTVAILIDDVPYGSSTTQGGGYLVPDIDPSDLAQVEVLRGPQGTLYGASSIGGLLKYVTVDPSIEAFTGRAEIGFSDVRGGGDEGYNFRGAVNIPLGDTFAIRASGFTGREAGYVDNPLTGEQDINRRDNDGGRLAALWRPSERVSVKLTALLQDSERHGTDEVDKSLSGLQRNALRRSGGYVRDTQAYAATIRADLGRAEIVSASGYSIDKIETNIDVTASFGEFANASFGVSGSSAPFHRKTEKVSQELRLLVPLGERVKWMIGAFYTDERVDATGDFAAVNPADGGVVGTLLTLATPSDFTEYSAFTNVTFTFTDRFDVQLGGRLSHNELSFHTIRSGVLQPIFFPNAPNVPEVNSEDEPFTYLVTPRWKISRDFMLYARFASGYRPGGPNTTCGTANIPCQFGADTTENYEIGLKGAVLEGAVSFDASMYYIDWKDVQLSLSTGALGFQDNAGAARSQGAELSLQSNPVDGLTVSAWVAFSEAELAEDFPETLSRIRGAEGDPLPYSSRWSGNFSIDQEFPLGRATGFLGGSISYVGERKGQFKATPVRQSFPSYTQTDLRAGVVYESWTLNMFCNNVSDERGVLRSGLDATVPNPDLFTYIQPRTIGFSVTKSF